jgi:hypothetical protein
MLLKIYVENRSTFAWFYWLSYVVQFAYGASLYANGDSNMHMVITVCIRQSPFAYVNVVNIVLPYAYRDPHMHTGIPICIWGFIGERGKSPYAYGDPPIYIWGRVHCCIPICI